jgi:hypothetical protein
LECGRFWVISLYHGHGRLVGSVVIGVDNQFGGLCRPFLSVRSRESQRLMVICHFYVIWVGDDVSRGVSSARYHFSY